MQSYDYSKVFEKIWTSQMINYFGTKEVRHFGDNLIALDLLKKMAYQFDFRSEFMPHFDYIGDGIKDLNQFVEKCDLVEITNHQVSDSVDLWTLPWIWNSVKCGNDPSDPFPEKYLTGHGIQEIFEMWYVFGNAVCHRFNLPKINNKLEDVLLNDDVYKVPISHPAFDILVVNSYGYSQQMSFPEKEQDEYFEKLVRTLNQAGHSTITTKKIFGVPCTQDSKLSLVDIGRLANKCDVVLGCPTSPFLSTLNQVAFNSTKYINMSHTTPNQGTLWFSLGVENIPADHDAIEKILEFI